MNINGKHWRTIWLEDDGCAIGVIDQTKLPHVFTTLKLKSCQEVAKAISSMIVRGAPLIGVAGAYGLMLALMENSCDEALEKSFEKLVSTRPTAVNLRWSLQRVFQRVQYLEPALRVSAARDEADLIAKEDVLLCEAIGVHGLSLLKRLCESRPLNRQNEPLNLLTHCNAGWLATVDWGTALAPIYKAHRSGLKLHVWVDETRPRNQGTNLTAFELGCEGIPHTVIADNTGGHLMRNGLVDGVIVGADRVASNGDICNKIGTYLKALAAYDNQLPFYVAIPSSTVDWSISDGSLIPIENRSGNEVTQIQGVLASDARKLELIKIRLSPVNTKALNPAFDVTPSRLVTSLLTEHGEIPATREGLLGISERL